MLLGFVISAAHADDYYVAGVVLAVSMVNEGPAPSFLAKELFQAMIGQPENVDVPLQSLPDSSMKQDLLQVN